MTAVRTKEHKRGPSKQEKGRAREGRDVAAAESVDREPDPEATPEDATPAVSREDEPRGQPTSDRFHTEQAHRKAGDKA
ncbi:MAG TPA: hypothetical protein VL752_16075 [Acidisoma sp.]|uniref:hypothetical protein n=1 Tax=Acidisoma sp. TaxID=1872115 RepID=UPI002BB5DBEA|nr:hypothetical protein [Acidisoma sp.]HTI02468.1 hypothetical protein [Acidisoma sp.]